MCVLLSTFSSSEALNEAAGKQARLPRPLQGAFVPAVLPLLMDKHHVPFPQLDLCLALGRVGHHYTIPLSGQGFWLRPEDHQSIASACCRGRPGEIGVQGTGLPVQRLESDGPRHLTLDRTGAGSPL